jgi:23S rRNA (adenine2030-N6)-methyltransferase
MPYNHAGEIGDVWKHLPLCDILTIESPIRYHESNSAYSGYTITKNPRTDYGVFHSLEERTIKDSRYFDVLKRNGIDNGHYTGSPGLSMDILSDKSNYYFHDIELDALSDVMTDAKKRNLESHVKTFCGDSINAFLNKEYVLDKNDFVFLDPYSPFDNNVEGFNFLDIFEKSVSVGSMTLLWYGYENLEEKKKISNYLKKTATKLHTKIWYFNVWLRCMTDNDCKINPGVPGCGLTCANLSCESINVLEKYMNIIGEHYSNATYCSNEASLLTEATEHCYK